MRSSIRIRIIQMLDILHGEGLSERLALKNHKHTRRQGDVGKVGSVSAEANGQDDVFDTEEYTTNLQLASNESCR